MPDFQALSFFSLYLYNSISLYLSFCLWMKMHRCGFSLTLKKTIYISLLTLSHQCWFISFFPSLSLYKYKICTWKYTAGVLPSSQSKTIYPLFSLSLSFSLSISPPLSVHKKSINTHFQPWKCITVVLPGPLKQNYFWKQ